MDNNKNLVIPRANRPPGAGGAGPPLPISEADTQTPHAPPRAEEAGPPMPISEAEMLCWFTADELVPANDDIARKLRELRFDDVEDDKYRTQLAKQSGLTPEVVKFSTSSRALDIMNAETAEDSFKELSAFCAIPPLPVTVGDIRPPQDGGV
ncbi:hypothetical protein Hte_012560 [Hypoxylon texense]